MAPPNNEERTLSDADLEALRETMACHTCSFSADQVNTLHSIANHVGQTQKVATKILIYGFVASILGGIWIAVKQLVITILTTGKLPGE